MSLESITYKSAVTALSPRCHRLSPRCHRCHLAITVFSNLFAHYDRVTAYRAFINFINIYIHNVYRGIRRVNKYIMLWASLLAVTPSPMSVTAYNRFERGAR